MFQSMLDFYADLSNWLIQKIDADPDYNAEVSIDHYLMATVPDEYALYKALEKVLNKFNKSEEN